MTAPTLIRPPHSPARPSPWLAGLHRVEEGTTGTLQTRMDFVRNALALVQPMSVLELGTDPGLRDRLSREGHAVYSAPVGRAGSAGFPTQVQRIAGVTHFFGYGDASDEGVLSAVAGRLSAWGWLGLKILDRDSLSAWLPEEEVLHRHGTWFRLHFRFDRRSGYLDVASRKLERPGKPHGQGARLRLRAYTLTEMEAILNAAGLRLEAVFSSMEGGVAGGPPEKPAAQGKALWLVARKGINGPRK